MIFANETVTTAPGFFPEYFGTMLLAMVLVFAIGLALFAFGWRAVDWITPGCLTKELLGGTETDAADGKKIKQPNMALAIVVGSMLLGLAMVLSATIIGVLVH